MVVVSWRQRELARACLKSLAGQSTPHQVVFVDNASRDGTVEMVRAEFPNVELVENSKNLGFAGGMAAALNVVDTRFVALLNNDAEAHPEWLARSLEVLADRHIAAVTSKMLLRGVECEGHAVANNTGVVLLSSMYGADRHLGLPEGGATEAPAEVFGFAGGAAVLRTLAVKAVGGFDADYFMYYEDTDLSWRLRLAGWRVLYCPIAVVWHQHAASSDPASPSFAFFNERNRLRMVASNAPVGAAIDVWCRFCVTTASLLLKRVGGRGGLGAPVFDPVLRVRAFTSATASLPAIIASRARAPWGRARRARVLREWLGVDSRPVSYGVAG